MKSVDRLAYVVLGLGTVLLALLVPPAAVVVEDVHPHHRTGGVGPVRLPVVLVADALQEASLHVRVVDPGEGVQDGPGQDGIHRCRAAEGPAEGSADRLHERGQGAGIRLRGFIGGRRRRRGLAEDLLELVLELVRADDPGRLLETDRPLSLEEQESLFQEYMQKALESVQNARI